MAIADDIVGHAHIAYLGDPFEQYCGLNGKPLIGGWIEVFQAGTDTKYITMQNFDGAMNPFKVPLNADGRVVMLADPSLTYDIYVRNSYGDLVCSRLNVECTCPGDISISGVDTYIRNTDGTLDVSLQTSSDNRRVYTVNTHNKVLDVQSPLYFAENSNTATVIGFSGDNYVQKDYLNEYVASSISGKMDESKLEYNSNGEISAYDGSAFAGQGGAGDPEVNDLVHANSATWNDVSAKLDTTAYSTASGAFLTAIPDDYATKDYVQSSVSSKLDSSVFATVSGNFLTAHQSLDGLMSASLLGMSGNTITSYNNMPFPIGGEGDAEVNQIVHANSATWNNVSDKLDTTAFSTVSGNFLTAHQDLSDYLTKASADTLYQPSGNYADATALDGKVDTSSFTAFSSTTNEKIEYISGALSSTYELSAGNGIDITDYPNEQKTVISVTAQGGNQEVENLVTAQSATWNSVSDKLDTTAFSDVSSTFLTAHQDLSDYQTTAGMTAYQPVGSYLTADALDSVSGGWNQVSAKLDTTAFSDVSGTFLTAHQDISNKLDTTAFSDVSGTFLTAVPDTYLQNTDLSTTDGKVTAISGIPLSAGGDVPEGVMVESGLEYNAVQEISGYNGSAIAQYGAEKQWLVHDDTLVHASDSAQYALGVNVSAVQTLMGLDETMLWSGSLTWGQTAALNDSVKNYDRIRFYVEDSFRHRKATNELVLTDLSNADLREFALNMHDATTSYFGSYFTVYDVNEDGDSLTSVSGRQWWYSPWTSTGINGSTDRGLILTRVVGIDRKS